MYRATVARDSTFEGVFYLGVRTTGIFCRPTCAAKKPKKENVEFFDSSGGAISAGYRPCKRCRPIEPAGAPPAWLKDLLAEVEADPTRRWKDTDIQRFDIDPGRVRRWFQTHHGMTFHAYQRAMRLGMALREISNGNGLSAAAFDHGYESLSGFREAFERIFGDTPGRSRHSRKLTVTKILTPLGPMMAGAVDEGVCLLQFVDGNQLKGRLTRLRKRLDCVIVPGAHDHLTQLERELGLYFEGKLQDFSVTVFSPGTVFQMSVWEQLRAIPYGQTVSYGDIAECAGRPRAHRAVGTANEENPIGIVVPCHRVIRSDGTLSGYGGGVWRKRHLLELERNGVPSPQRPA